MNLIQTQAIVLDAIPFKEYDRILTLFSPQGLLKLFAKGKKRDYLHFAALTSPLTYGEFYFSEGRKDLHRLTDGSILKQNLRIRERYETLIHANKMIRSLLKSQWIGRAAPKLFYLFTLFIEHLPDANPETLYTVFLLKTLKHEGFLELSISLKSSYRFAGEKYSQQEAPQGAVFFEEEEEELLTECVVSRSLSFLSSQILAADFQTKVEKLFFQTFN